MNFVLHEIKLWFTNSNSEPEIYKFLPNKVNVISGKATTGKSSLWRIIDYCLLSNDNNIPDDIFNSVRLFGIKFTVDGNLISVIRFSPENGAPSDRIIINEWDNPNLFMNNVLIISDAREFLNGLFSIDSDIFVHFHGKKSKKNVRLFFRHFLLFNILSQNVIGSHNEYFEKSILPFQNFDWLKSDIFRMSVGLTKLRTSKEFEISREIDRINSDIKRKKKVYENKFALYNKNLTILKNLVVEANLSSFFQINDIENIDVEQITNKLGSIDYTNNVIIVDAELDNLEQRLMEVDLNISLIKKIQREFKIQNENYSSIVDSLAPIEYFKNRLSNKLFNLGSVGDFIYQIEGSLDQVKIDRGSNEPIPSFYLDSLNDFIIVKENLEELINTKREELNLMVLDKFQTFQLGIISNFIKGLSLPIIENSIVDETESQEIKSQVNIDEIKFLIESSIDIYFNYLKSKNMFSNLDIRFNMERVLLELINSNSRLLINNIGSTSNYMFLHLCLFLGLHSFFLNRMESLVPSFLFIDQPSTPYYSGKDGKGINDSLDADDDEKLSYAFELLNFFMEEIVEKSGKDFQIIMVDNAVPKYWESKFDFFHTVVEFRNGKALIPNNDFKK